MNRARCQWPRWQPTMINPAGDCGAEAPTMAARLGGTGLWLSLCPACAPRRPDAVPIGEVEEP